MSCDIFFISYNESNAEKNWQRLKELHPSAKRIHGVPSISQSHLLCDDISESRRYYTVDGDNWLLKPIPPDFIIGCVNYDLVTFSAIDPIDNTVSNCGGVKLWKKGSHVNKDMSKGDFTKYATKNIFSLTEVLSIHKYDVTPFESWRHTFRQSVKCLSGIIGDSEKNLLLLKQHEKLNEWSYRGYVDAKKYVDLCEGNFTKINKINDYWWLQEHFNVSFNRKN